MYRKKPEDIVTEETKVWICTSEECKGWVRDNFKSSESETPICPLCKSEMKASTKVLEVINNHKKY